MVLRTMEAVKPEDAVSLLVMATQIAGWPEPVYASTMSGPSHAPVFSATASFCDGSGAADGAGHTAARAKQRAAWALLWQRAGMVCPPPARIEAVERRTSPAAATAKPFRFDPGKDPIMQLMEHGQALGVVPSFVFEQAGPPHAPTMTCTCSVGTVVRTANAGSKKDAKRLAAKATIDAMIAMQVVEGGADGKDRRDR